ncbi:Protein kinase domain-containing protein [Dinochytrium kinnereticum]|nr:Protein kinase domain-containing protein [Dinochytrium kinnereticum]
MPGGDLFTYLQNGPVPSYEAKFITFQILSGLNYLHKHQIAHRDIKAPEVFDSIDGYLISVDCWALGVLIFFMIFREFPFGGDDNLALQMKRIRSGSFSFPSDFDPDTDKEVQSFIRALLEVNPDRRMSTRECMEHSWIRSSKAVLLKLQLKALRRAKIC